MYIHTHTIACFRFVYLSHCNLFFSSFFSNSEFFFKYIRKVIYNNNHTSITCIELYKIPHIFYIRIFKREREKEKGRERYIVWRERERERKKEKVRERMNAKEKNVCIQNM